MHDCVRAYTRACVCVSTLGIYAPRNKRFTTITLSVVGNASKNNAFIRRIKDRFVRASRQPGRYIITLPRRILEIRRASPLTGYHFRHFLSLKEKKKNRNSRTRGVLITRHPRGAGHLFSHDDTRTQ